MPPLKISKPDRELARENAREYLENSGYNKKIALERCDKRYNTYYKSPIERRICKNAINKLVKKNKK